jgi:hypothetical protein
MFIASVGQQGGLGDARDGHLYIVSWLGPRKC